MPFREVVGCSDQMIFFYEYAKRNERVITDDNRYANFHSLARSFSCKLFGT